MKHTLLAVAIFLALVSAASAAPTKAAYIKEADQLCKAANTAIAPISAKLNQLNLNTASGITQAVKLLHAALSIEGVAYDKLIALPKPPADKTVLTHIWETLHVELSNIGKLIDALDDLNATAIRKDESAINLAKAALDHEHATALVKVGEHRHIVMAASRAGLIDPDPLNPFEVLRVDREVDVVMHDPPNPHV